MSIAVSALRAIRPLRILAESGKATEWANWTRFPVRKITAIFVQFHGLT